MKNSTQKIQNIFELTPLQEGILFHSIYQEDNNYVIQTAYALKGDLKQAIVKESLNYLFKRHDTLRAAIVFEKVKQPVQVILSDREADFNYIDLTQESTQEQVSYIKKYEADDRAKGFNLTKDALLRLTLIKLDDASFYFVWTFHHILMDGWCVEIISKELEYIYDCLINEKRIELDPVTPYSAYVKWLRKKKTIDSTFWQNYLEGFSQTTGLPSYLHNGEHKMKHQELMIDLPQQLIGPMEAIIKSQHITLNVFLQSIWGLVLSRINNTEDVAFGFISSGRPEELDGVEKMIGLFINIVPLRIQAKRDISIKALFQQVKNDNTALLAHQHSSIVDIKSATNHVGSLIDHVFILENYPLAKELVEENPEEEDQLIISDVSVHDYTHYDFSLVIMPSDEELTLKFEYNEHRYEHAFIESIAHLFIATLEKAVEHPDLKVGDLVVQKPTQISPERATPDRKVNSATTVLTLFDEMVKTKPDHIAVVEGEKEYSYRWLSDASDQLASRISEQHQVSSGERILSIASPSVWGLVSMLGIFKAGAVYIPISPELPEARKQWIVENSDVKLILCDSRREGLKIDLLTLVLPEVLANIDLSNCKEIPKPRPETTAYIIYTSGTTGLPKGVMISHDSLAQFILSLKQQQAHDASWNYLLLSPLYFDASLKSIFLPFSIGATVHIGPDSRDLKSLGVYISEKSINAMHATPRLWEELLNVVAADKLQSLRCISSGGDLMSTQLAKSMLETFDSPYIYNTYGPTETTINATIHQVTLDSLNYKSIPIGHSLDGYEVYIADENGHDLPTGVPGEIYIEGNGLAQAYINNRAEAKSDFAKNESTGHKIFKSRDSGVLLPIGDILFLGRKDDQLKIRGYRISPTEVSFSLEQHPAILQAIVTGIKHDHAYEHLVAYYVAEQEIDPARLRGYLETKLPAYMVPAFYVHLKSIPLLPNGKVDEKSLPSVKNRKTYARGNFEPPSTKTEQLLLNIWQDLLELEQVGVTENFFEIGGHSLKATRLMTAVQNQLKVSIGLKEIFQFPTIRLLADHIRHVKESVEIPAINSVAKKPLYGVSNAQKRIWLLSQFKEDNAAYNMPYALTVDGEVDEAVLVKTIALLMDRHESLRTVFINQDGEPFQKIKETLKVPFSKTNLADKSVDARDLIIRRIYEEDAERPFDLEHGPLFMFHLISLSEKSHVLVFVIHHIISDGWSQGILGNDFVTIYNALINGDQPQLPSITITYKDYTNWHNQLIEEGFFRRSENYWLEKLADKPKGVMLPTDMPRQALQTFNGRRNTFSLGKELTNRLYDESQKSGTTLYMSLMAIVSVFLQKYSGQSDIVIGLPIAGRKSSDLYNVVGFMVNTIVYRMQVSSSERFSTLLEKVKAESLDIYEYQDYPFDLLVDKLELERNMSHSPLFNVMVAYNNTNTGEDAAEIDGLEIEDYHLDDDFNMSKFDLIFFIQDDDEDIVISLEYNSDLFLPETIQRMTANFKQLANAVSQRFDSTIADLNIISPEEENLILKEFNDSFVDYSGKTAVEWFESAVQNFGQKDAICYGKERITYEQLNVKANQLAHYLIQEKGVKNDDTIGLVMDRSIEMVVAILGIIKAGAAYVAIDPNYPVKRVQHMLDDSKVALLVADLKNPALLRAYEGETILLPELQDTLSKYQTVNPQVPIDMSSPIYIIYTSGSTGMPNGAILSHGLLSNLISWHYDDAGIDKGLSCVQFTSINFCVSFQEIFTTLSSGGLLHLIGEVERQDIEYLVKFLSENQIEVLYLPFSYLNFLFNEADRALESYDFNLKHIVTAGEQLKITPGLKKFVKRYPDLKLHNHYGSSEMHVVTAHTMDSLAIHEENLPPVGKPIANTGIYMLNEHRSLVPVGVWGEVCVSGSHEVSGYINNEKLSRERLIEHPYAHDKHCLYASGDIGRWLSDGTIEVKGRKDVQFKIRGFRVEPGEIEATIFSYPPTKDCVVVVKETEPGQMSLLAYIVLHEGNVKQLKSHLEERLPDYMIPKFIQLEALPLMPNGKVDREALPEPSLEEISTPFIAARNEKEKILTELWKKILTIPDVGVLDNFFERGGHSLKATKLVAQIHAAFGQKLELMEIFKNPTIEAQAILLHQVAPTSQPSIEQAPEQTYYPLTPPQKQLWVLENLHSLNGTYHMPSVVEIKGDLVHERLKTAITGVMAKHEALRTSFISVDGEPMQRINAIERLKIPFEYVDLTNSNDVVEARENKLKEFLAIPFDLKSDSLFRSLLIQTDTADYSLAINMHHIISDAHAYQVLYKEIGTYYDHIGNGDQTQLPDLAIQFKDYAYDLLKKSSSLIEQNARDYWYGELQKEMQPLDLPLDFARTENKTYRGAKYNTKLGTAVAREIKKLAKDKQTSLYAMFVSITSVLFHKYGGQSGITLGGILSNRVSEDLEALIGMLVSTIPIRNEVSHSDSFDSFLQQVTENLTKATEYAAYPVDELLRELKIDGGTDLYRVMVSYEQVSDADEESVDTDFYVDDHALEVTSSKFDLTFFLEDSEDDIALAIQYNTDLFKAETIERLGGHFKHIIAQVLESMETKIAKLRLITPEEEHQILRSFNATLPVTPAPGLLELWYEALSINRENKAVSSKREFYTYGQLEDNSSRIGVHLYHVRKVKPGDHVAIIAEKTPQFIAALLGIIKAGATYVPIDPTYPENRVLDILQSSGASYLMIDDACYYNFGALGKIEKISIETAIEEEQSTAGQYQRIENAIAYTIYTSGTSGTPKGVPISDQALVQLSKWSATQFDLNARSKMTCYASIGFDASVWEIWSALLSGAQLLMLDDRVRMNMMAMSRFFMENEVTHSFLPTPVYEQFVKTVNAEDVADITFLTGGDKLRTYNPGFKVFNNYGPTEAAVVATSYRLEGNIDGTGINAIGKPVPHHQVYILGQDRQLLPVGTIGQIAISSQYISSGYINNQEISKRHFVDNPYQSDLKLYLTGDMGQWTVDGSILFEGRKDDQVKISGRRIELGEIEQHLMNHPQITDCLVRVTQDILVAYTVSHQPVAVEDLKGFLKESLPFFMVPTYFVDIPEFPLTAHGKVDLDALPAILSTKASNSVPLSLNEEEQLVSKVWQEVFNLTEISVYADFFELGGHSLTAIDILSKLNQQTGAELDISVIFEGRTIAALAEALRHSNGTNEARIETDQIGQEYVLSHAQKRLWAAHQLDPDKVAFLIPMVFTLEGVLVPEILKQAFFEVINNHESLRTSFFVREDDVYQKVREVRPEEMEMILEDISSFSAEQQQSRMDDLVRKETRTPVDLEYELPFRVRLVSLSNTRHQLFFTIHHILFDALSCEVLLREVVSYYQFFLGKEPKPDRPTHQYRDFVNWDYDRMKTSQYKEEEHYWRTRMEGCSPELNLIFDHARPMYNNYKGGKFHKVLKGELRREILDFNHGRKTTAFIFFFTCVNALLYRYTGQRDMLIGVPFNGRQKAEFQNIIGYFVNTLPLRSKFENAISFDDLLSVLHNDMMETFRYQQYPLDKIMDHIRTNKDNISPFRVGFTWHSDLKELPEKNMPFAIHEYDVELSDAKADLWFHMGMDENQVAVTIEYATALFEEASIQLMYECLEELVKQVIKCPEIALDEIELSISSQSTARKREISGFNIS